MHFNNQPIDNSDKYSNTDDFFDRRGGFVLNKLDRRMTAHHYSDALNYPIQMPDGSNLYPGNSKVKVEHWNWRWSQDKVKWGIEKKFIIFKETQKGWSVYFKQYEKVDNEDKEIQRTSSYQNYLEIKGANSARGTKEVMNLLNGKFFDYPKPLNLIMYIEKMVLDPNSIILDFFSGSATTAHAVMKLNAEDGGNRKYIMVQLPEVCDEKSEAAKAGFKNICEIGEERIRRAGNQILEQNLELSLENLDKNDPDYASKIQALSTKHSDLSSKLSSLSSKLDIGFRVFKLDESGIERPDPMQLLVDVVKPDRTHKDIVFEMMLKWGLELTLAIKKINVAGYEAYSVGAGELICCMNKGLTQEALREIVMLSPNRVFILDRILDDKLKLNAIQIFKHAGTDIELRTV